MWIVANTTHNTQHASERNQGAGFRLMNTLHHSINPCKQRMHDGPQSIGMSSTCARVNPHNLK